MWSARSVGYLELGLVGIEVVEEVDIAALVEAVVGGPRCWIAEVVVDVREESCEELLARSRGHFESSRPTLSAAASLGYTECRRR